MANKAILLLSLFLIYTISNAIKVENQVVHRLLQYQKGTIEYGSKMASINMIASTNLETNAKSEVLLVPINNITSDLYEKIRSSNLPGAILFIFPNNMDELTTESYNKWIQLEQHLISSSELNVPIYFTTATYDLEALFDSINNKESFQTTDQTYIVVNSKSPSVIKTTEIMALSGFLPGLKQSINTPTIILSTSLDSFSSVPSLAFGCDQGASGVVALLQLARMFSDLYSNESTIGRYNLMFFLSSGSKFDFEGTRLWIEKELSETLASSIEVVISIDSIGKGDKLFLQASRPSKDAVASKVYDIFTETANTMNIPFEIVQKKIKKSESDVFWEHEQFARGKIFGVTLTHFEERKSPLERSDVFDNMNNIDMSILRRNIEYLTRVLGKIIYNIQDDVKIVSRSEISDELIGGWISTVCATPRMVPYSKTDNPVYSYIIDILKQYTSDINVHKFKLSSQYTFFDKEISTMSSYKSKPIIFDIAFSLCNLAFAFALYAYFKGFSTTISELTSLINGKTRN